MPRRTLTASLLLGVLLTGLPAHGAVEPVSWLLEQIRIGEATGREDLVSNSLYSLSLIDEAHPELLAAQARQALRQGKVEEAKRLLAQLGQVAPDSPLYRQGMANLALNEPAKRQQLQQARLLVNAGRLDEAQALYQSLLVDGLAPNLEVAVEYALLQARIPAQHAKGVAALQALEQQYPGQSGVRAGLARQLLNDGRNQEAFAILGKMAQSPSSRGEAAEIWLAAIKEMPVGAQSIKALEQYIVTFGSGDNVNEAQTLLADYESKWASPAFRSRQRALERRESGTASVAELQRALAQNPSDTELMGALGEAYSRNNQRALAIAQFEKVLRQSDVKDPGKWQGLLDTNRYWLLLEQADKAQEKGDLDRAQSLYQQAQRLDGREPEGWLGLGDVQLARGNKAEAERTYRKVLSLEPGNERALRRLFDLYREEDPAKALAFIEQTRSRNLASLGHDLKAELLQQEADLLEQQGNLDAALAKRQQALAMQPQDVWLAYRTANLLAATGHPEQGEKLLRDRLAATPRDTTLRYATALYLSGQDKDSEARTLLAGEPASGWSEKMHELDARLARGARFDEARRLREAGDEAAAEQLLVELLPDERALRMLAEWAQERGEWQVAEQHYRTLLEKDPDDPQTRLSMARLLLAKGDRAGARSYLPAWPVSPLPGGQANFYRQVANLYHELGDEQTASAIFDALSTEVARQPASEASALFWRDAARQRFAQGDNEGALAFDRKALTAAGLAPREDIDDASLTRIGRAREGEGWLAAGLRSDLDKHYRQSQTTVSLDSDYWGDKGTGGISDLRALTQMLQLDTPLAAGRAFGRLEWVHLDAGSFADSPYREKFGTCYQRDCYGDEQQKSDGVTLAAGWANERVAFDLGTTPLGFEVVDWVGGASVKSDWHDFGFTFTASRRPISSSLLSYAGTVDPGTGIRWGGVRANGVRVDVSHDLGGAVGYWGSLQQHLLTGENVEDNWRTRLMGGTYYKVVNEEHRRVSVGLSSMLWRFQHDLSAYTLGQGGYYSPQRYFSLAVPVNYRQRTPDWSWELGGSVSWSASKTDDERRYPLQGLIPTSLPDRDALEEGSSSTGFGYTLNALVEHRLTDHWRIGGRVDIQQADDYAPSHFLLYLRYTFKPWQGDLDMPPQPLTPYADFD